MPIYLGNMTVRQIEERLGITLDAEASEFLARTRQDIASNLAPDKWHCYDLPFIIACGSREMATKVMEILRPYSEQMKVPIQIGVDTK